MGHLRLGLESFIRQTENQDRWMAADSWARTSAVIISIKKPPKAPNPPAGPPSGDDTCQT